MALIKCPECGREISNAATSCPHCGYPLGEVTATVDAVMDDATHADVNDTSVASPPPRKRKSGPIIAIVVVAVLAVAFGFFFSQQRKTAARKEYIANLITASDLMYSGGVSAETAYNRVHDVWYNTIFKKSDMYTNKYTIKPSKYKESILTFYNDKDFNDDFNTSLDALFSSEEYKSTVASLNNNKNQVSDLYSKLQTPPDDLSYCLSPFNSMYDAYISAVNCAVNPTGSLTTYTEKCNKASDDMISAMNKLMSITDGLK